MAMPISLMTVRTSDVDHAGTLDDVGDTAHGTGQYIVGLGESRQQAGVLAQDGQQLLIGDGDQRVDALGEHANAFVGDLHALATFERERTRDDSHGQDAHFLGHFGDDRRSAGAGAPAHAGGDEDHVGALQHFGDTLAVFQGGLAAHFRVGASAQALRHAGTQLQNGARADVFQRLGVGIGADELNAFNIALDHMVDRVAAATTHTDNLDHRALRDVVYEFEHFPSPVIL
jgi:hypothetical protein